MASYFDPNVHVTLIPSSLRDHDDLPTVSEQAERDVIAHFTTRYPASQELSSQFAEGPGYLQANGLTVCLQNFNPDSASCTDAGLVLALRDTVADVVKWRLSKTGESPLLTSVGANPGASKSFRSDVHHDFPPGGWTRRLGNWDIRVPVYST